jgi:hypothetical protein
MSKQVNLAELAKASGGTRRQTAPEAVQATEIHDMPAPKPPAAERFPITLTQQPEAVRQQLMMLKAKSGKTIENIAAEAFNDLFAKYGMPEIAVVKPKRGRAA